MVTSTIVSSKANILEILQHRASADSVARTVVVGKNSRDRAGHGAKKLKKFAKSVHSQDGEDGVIREVFARLHKVTPTCRLFSV